MDKLAKAILLARDYLLQKSRHTIATAYLDSSILFSNGYPISSDSEWVGQLQSFPVGTELSSLKQFFECEGYLWIKHLFPRSEVYALNQECHSTLELHQRDFILSPLYQYRIRQQIRVLQKSSAYLQFTESPYLKKLIEEIFGFSPQILKRKLIRVKLPHSPVNTGAHYDYNYVRRSSAPVYTIWLPIGDIPANAGGIIYLANSQSISRHWEQQIRKQTQHLPIEAQHTPFHKVFDRHGWMTKDLLSLARKCNSQWLIGNFEAGDIIIHHPYLIHAALMNSHPHKQVSISTDIRFQCKTSTPDIHWEKRWSSFDELNLIRQRVED